MLLLLRDQLQPSLLRGQALLQLLHVPRLSLHLILRRRQEGRAQRVLARCLLQESQARALGLPDRGQQLRPAPGPLWAA